MQARLKILVGTPSKGETLIGDRSVSLLPGWRNDDQFDFNLNGCSRIHTVIEVPNLKQQLIDALEREAVGTDGGYVDGINTAVQLVEKMLT